MSCDAQDFDSLSAQVAQDGLCASCPPLMTSDEWEGQRQESIFECMRPARDANKYSRGKLVVVAGSARYPGAAVLAACAGQRMGAGYTEVVTHPRAVDIVRSASPSLVVRTFSEWNVRDMPAASAAKPCAVCVGPGFVPGDEESAPIVTQALKAPCPVLVDGGALARLASKKAMARLAKRAGKDLATVVTPHGGEASRLATSLGLSHEAPEVLARDLARALHAIVVLKGPDTHISDGARTVVMAEGTPALAKAGTGDVLAGMTCSLLAQGMDAFDAAVAASLVHARAGKAAAEHLTDVCVCAEDVLQFIPDALR